MKNKKTMIKVAVNGALGKMGQETIKAINESSDLNLLGELDVNNPLENFLSNNTVDAVVDFTTPETRMETVKTILAGGAAAVVGTTGFTEDDLAVIKNWTKKYNKGVLIAPNFAIGTILQMNFAKKASKYFETAEIIEYHHNQKADFPSGTAVKTAQLMAESRETFNKETNDKVANIQGARGGDHQGIKVHSVRLPGMIAHQEVIFGAQGQYLTLRHDATSRETYMPGVLMAIRHIVNDNRLTYGLEHILSL